MLLHNLKLKHVLSNACFSKLLRQVIIKSSNFLRNALIELTLHMVDFMMLNDNVHLYFPLTTNYSKIRYCDVIMDFSTTVQRKIKC